MLTQQFEEEYTKYKKINFKMIKFIHISIIAELENGTSSYTYLDLLHSTIGLEIKGIQKSIDNFCIYSRAQ